MYGSQILDRGRRDIPTSKENIKRKSSGAARGSDSLPPSLESRGAQHYQTRDQQPYVLGHRVHADTPPLPFWSAEAAAIQVDASIKVYRDGTDEENEQNAEQKRALTLEHSDDERHAGEEMQNKHISFWSIGLEISMIWLISHLEKHT